MLNSIEKAILDFDFGNYGLDVVEKTKDDLFARDWVYDLAKLIGARVLVQFTDQAITAELITASEMDVIHYTIDKLIADGNHIITIRGTKIG